MSNQENNAQPKPQAEPTNSVPQPAPAQPTIKPAATIKPNDNAKLPSFHLTYENDQTKKK